MRTPLVCVVVAAAAVPVLAQSAAPPPFLARVTAYVEQYYARTQRVVVEEISVFQPLGIDLGPAGFAREIVYETRMEWDPASPEPAKVSREILRERGPRIGRPGKAECVDQSGLSPEPLSFLLPGRHDNLRFRMAGTDRIGDRTAAIVEYTPITRSKVTAEWKDGCGQVDISGHVRGRLWADADTGAVLKVEERLIAPVDVPPPADSRRLYFTYDRRDVTLEYRAVHFENPEETVLLPYRISMLSVVLGTGTPRFRLTQTYTNYRRFLTESRVLPVE